MVEKKIKMRGNIIENDGQCFSELFILNFPSFVVSYEFEL